MPTFSIIIPHKDIPDLLERCLKSIPQRNDLQVIVVDDDKRRGAGFARNVGLEQAKGRWLIFADADDFFLPDFEKMLDRYADSDADMICFANTVADSDNLSKEIEHPQFDMYSKIAKARHCGMDIIRYDTGVVWCRFIKRELVERVGAKFQETICRNDTLFAVMIGSAATKILLDETAIYCYTKRPDNTVDNQNLKFEIVRFSVSKSVMKYLKSRNNATGRRIFNDDMLFWYEKINANKWLYIKEILPVFLLTTTKKTALKTFLNNLF